MKKQTALLLAALLALPLTACSSTGEGAQTTAPSSSQASQPSESVSESGEPVKSDSADGATAEPESEQTNSHMLVVYFTYAENAALAEDVDVSSSASIQRQNGTLTGNTGLVASMIAETAGADLFSLHTVEQYPDTYSATVDQGQQERTDGVRPELTALPENLADYDVIFLGYPSWWSDMPMAVYSFLDAVDLSGKTIAPFVTSGGSGLAGTVGTIEELEPGSVVQSGLAIRDSDAAGAQEQVNAWLTELGYLN